MTPGHAGLMLALALAGAPAPASAAASPDPAPAPAAQAGSTAGEATSPAAPEDVFDAHRRWSAFAYTVPLGIAAGYLWAGRPERAIAAPLGAYGLVGVGIVAGYWERRKVASWNVPASNPVGFVLGPFASLGGAVVVVTGVALLDQALLPHPGDPWVAPGLTLGTMSLMAIADRLVTLDQGFDARRNADAGAH